MQNRLQNLLQTTIEDCFQRGLLRETQLPEYVIEVPNNPEHGHFATNLPLTLAASQKRPPQEIAAVIVEHLEDDLNLLASAEVAGPGFINFRIKADHWYRLVEGILAAGENYGRSDIGQAKKVMVEFVSANPTGPLHLGHARGAALGDTLSRIMEFCGYDIVREFYINDAGQQIRLLGESIYARWKEFTDESRPFPESCYPGDYVRELAKTIAGEIDLDSLSAEEAIELCTQKGKAIMLEEIRKDLESFGVNFDVWYSEKDLFESGLLDQALQEIRGREHLYERDGALWIKTSSFGDDKDRVIRKNDGHFTYFASDIAYHLEKRKRGVEKAINIWGADHHGYVPRMQAALSAHGFPQGWLEVILVQLVKLWKDGRELKMSKRAGSFVTLQELIEEVGVDAVRFVLLTKNSGSSLDVDIDLIKKQDNENPVYYVQYAHARLCSVLRKAAGEGIPLVEANRQLLRHLTLEEEMTLIRTMARFPGLLEDIAATLEPHRLTYYLGELAALFHRYFNLGTRTPAHRIVTADKALSQARLLLASAVRTVISNGLRLLGISAPQKM